MTYDRAMGSKAAFPSSLFLIRHGEKVGDPASEGDGGPDLSIRGSARAAALPSLFTPTSSASGAGAQLGCRLDADRAERFTGTYATPGMSGGPPRFPAPQHLIATRETSHSNRPIETV